MFTTNFAKQTIERALKTAAQTLILAVGAAQGFDLFATDWNTLGAAAAGGFILSVLTSIASAPFGTTGTPSAIKSEWVSVTANGPIQDV
jgi:hypothetical protein